MYIHNYTFEGWKKYWVNYHEQDNNKRKNSDFSSKGNILKCSFKGNNFPITHCIKGPDINILRREIKLL